MQSRNISAYCSCGHPRKERSILFSPIPPPHQSWPAEQSNKPFQRCCFKPLLPDHICASQNKELLHLTRAKLLPQHYLNTLICSTYRTHRWSTWEKMKQDLKVDKTEDNHHNSSDWEGIWWRVVNYRLYPFPASAFWFWICLFPFSPPTITDLACST